MTGMIKGFSGLKRILAVIVAIGASAAMASDLQPQLIYGEDGRAEVYQSHPALQALADSTVALIPLGVLNTNGAGVRISGEIFGPTYGLCTDEPYFNQPTSANCSGFLVAPDMIATAGHCVDVNSCANWGFVFGYRMNDGQNANMDVPASEVYRCASVVARELTRAQDYAIVKLDRPVTNHRVLKLAANPPQVGDPMLVIGHPAGLPTKITTGGKVRSSVNGYFVTNLDTYGGNSGSAVFNANTGEVAGILVRGDQDFVQDPAGQCARSNVCPEDGCRGEDVTHISFVKAAMKGGSAPATRSWWDWLTGRKAAQARRMSAR